VQVSTNITLRFETKVELLGANGKTNVVEPFLQRIGKTQALSDFRVGESKPFHLHADLQAGESATGTYEETWLSPKKWRRQAQLGGVAVVESRSDDKFYRKVEGAEFAPRAIDAFLDGIDGLFPGKEYAIYEADWGQSAVQLDGVNMVRVARGKVNEKNQPITGSAYWFDSAGLLSAAYVQPRTVMYRNYEAWNGKQVPRQMEILENWDVSMDASFDRIEPPTEASDSLFILEDVAPEPVGDSVEYAGPRAVPPQPIFRVPPENPGSEHGTVGVYLEMDTHGHVLTAAVRQSGGQTLDDAAVRAAMKWEFTPMLVKGKRVHGFATLRFDF
jgi:TonB family protein